MKKAHEYDRADGEKGAGESRASLLDIQSILVRLCTDPEALETFVAKGALPGVSKDLLKGIDAEQVKTYHRGVWGKRELFARATFPLMRRLLGSSWSPLHQKYWAGQPASSPNPYEALAGLPDFVRTLNDETTTKFPFLADLAQYEYLRHRAVAAPIAIERGNRADLRSPGNRKKFGPAINQTIELSVFDYPVHTIARHIASKGKKVKGNDYDKCDLQLAIYRDPDTDEVRIQELGGVVSELLVLAKEKWVSYENLIEKAAALISDETPEEIANQVVDLMEELETAGVILGSSIFTESTGAH